MAPAVVVVEVSRTAAWQGYGEPRRTRARLSERHKNTNRKPNRVELVLAHEKRVIQVSAVFR